MSVSIIIKTLNEEKRIAEAVESALKALPGGKVEVIVADSGSTDRTIEIARAYPIRIVQIEPPAQASCGLGPQLGFQYSTQPFICLIDGDMIIEPDFLPAALAYLDNHPDAGGVTGHVVDQVLESLEFQRRSKRHSPEARTGDIDRMNGGGLYRRSAIEQAGYFSDRNLHGHEEFDAGVRLRSHGWKLHRLDRPFVQHFGYTMNAYKLLVRRWKSKYLRGTGEVLRAAMGQPHQKICFANCRNCASGARSISGGWPLWPLCFSCRDGFLQLLWRPLLPRRRSWQCASERVVSSLVSTRWLHGYSMQQHCPLAFSATP
ncbi:glycosyltransferase family 2 protein [Brucella intermedia]